MRGASRSTIVPSVGRDQARGVAAEVVVLEIEFQHQAAADALADRSLDIDGACVLADEPLGELAAHRVLDATDARRGIRRSQVHLGEDQMQGRRRSAHFTLDAVPVLRLRGVLIAGDHGPFRQIDLGAGQEKPRQAEAGLIVHGLTVKCGDRHGTHRKQGRRSARAGSGLRVDIAVRGSNASPVLGGFVTSVSRPTSALHPPVTRHSA